MCKVPVNNKLKYFYLLLIVKVQDIVPECGFGLESKRKTVTKIFTNAACPVGQRS